MQHQLHLRKLLGTRVLPYFVTLFHVINFDRIDWLWPHRMSIRCLVRCMRSPKICTVDSKPVLIFVVNSKTPKNYVLTWLWLTLFFLWLRSTKLSRWVEMILKKKHQIRFNKLNYASNAQKVSNQRVSK